MRLKEGACVYFIKLLTYVGTGKCVFSFPLQLYLILTFIKLTNVVPPFELNNDLDLLELWIIKV